jgi:hypothetical protein
MKKILAIDKALYKIDFRKKIYAYYGRNSNFKKLKKRDNVKNKKMINGFIRIFKDGRKKVFKFKA